jgi:hypothetical protein
MPQFNLFRIIFFASILMLGVACQPTPTPTPMPPTPLTAPPTVAQDFRSTSDQTFIQYYTYTSGTCGASTSCNFRGLIHPPVGYDQAEVFLTGFTLETQNSTDKIERISAEVQKYRYEPATGEMEVGVNGRLETKTRQPYSYQVTFVVLLTNAAAKFTRVGNGCNGVAQCHVTATLPGAVPQGMHYIGLGTRIFDLGSTSGPIAVNAFSMHIDSINVQNLPNVQIDYLCALQDAMSNGDMFCEWDASVIAFDPAEMDRNNSNLFPQYTMVGTNVSVASQLNGQAQPFSGGSISGYFDAFEGLSLFYNQGQQNAIWLVDSSASGFQTTGSPPTAGRAQYGVFLGTNFGDKVNAQPYAFQLSRAVGLLR